MTAFTFFTALLAAALLEMIGDRLISAGERHESKALQRFGTMLTAISFAALALLAVELHGVR
jgi:hypothetical protein